MKTIKTTGYLQVEPIWANLYGVDRDDPDHLRGAKVVAVTQKRSPKPRAGVLEIAVTIEIPAGAFIPLRPEATIVIPESMTVPHPIAVEATDPNEETS